MFDLLATILISLGAFAVLLPLIVFVHEYGHFKVARLCGVKIDAFSIGFGPSIWQRTDKRGTVWKISAIPLGGYVKFFGDANAASAGASAEKDDAPTEGETEGGGPATTQFTSARSALDSVLTEEEKRVCFHFKPVWQRALIVAAGPGANFVLGIVIFAALFMSLGRTVIEARVGAVVPESPAAAAGFQPGDLITEVNGDPVRDFDELRLRVSLSSDSERRFTVERGGESVVLTATPERAAGQDAFGNEVRQGRLGIYDFSPPIIVGLAPQGAAAQAGLQSGDVIIEMDGASIVSFTQVQRRVVDDPGGSVTLTVLRGDERLSRTLTIGSLTGQDSDGTELTVGTIGAGPPPRVTEQLGPLAALGAGAGQVGLVVDGTLAYLGRLITLKEDPTQLGGPITITRYAGQAVMYGFNENLEIPFWNRVAASLTMFIQLAALISVSIGLLNLAPIPVLDGGHLVYYAYEAVAGRPLNDAVQAIGFRIGIVVVGSFMVFVIVNDVIQLFS